MVDSMSKIDDCIRIIKKAMQENKEAQKHYGIHSADGQWKSHQGEGLEEALEIAQFIRDGNTAEIEVPYDCMLGDCTQGESL